MVTVMWCMCHFWTLARGSLYTNEEFRIIITGLKMTLAFVKVVLMILLWRFLHGFLILPRRSCSGNTPIETGGIDINDWSLWVLHFTRDENDCLLSSGATMMQSAEHLVSFNEGSLTASCGLLLCMNIKKSWRRWYNSCGGTWWFLL